MCRLFAVFLSFIKALHDTIVFLTKSKSRCFRRWNFDGYFSIRVSAWMDIRWVVPHSLGIVFDMHLKVCWLTTGSLGRAKISFLEWVVNVLWAQFRRDEKLFSGVARATTIPNHSTFLLSFLVIVFSNNVERSFPPFCSFGLHLCRPDVPICVSGR